MRGGVLVVAPIPVADALDPADIDARIEQAVADALNLRVNEVFTLEKE